MSDFSCDPFGERNCFRQIGRFHRMGAQKVHYKQDTPQREETEAEKAFADVAMDRWRYTKDTFGGAAEQYRKEVDQQDSEGSYDFARGSAATATKSAFDKTRDKYDAATREQGTNPNSGRYRGGLARLSDAEAESSTDTQARAVTQQQDEYIKGVSNVSALGRGKAGTTQKGLSDVAALTSKKADRDAQMEWNNQAAGMHTAGALTGAAASGLQSVDFGNNNRHNELNQEYGYDDFGDPFAAGG